MAKVVARKETGKLVIDFTYRGVRCREQTALIDTPGNRKRVEALVKKLELARKKGEFRYRDFFPQSTMAARFDEPGSGGVSLGSCEEEIEQGPGFAEYAEHWFDLHVIEWRHSCRIPDDWISPNRQPLFLARAVMAQLMLSLNSSGSL